SAALRLDTLCPSTPVTVRTACPVIPLRTHGPAGFRYRLSAIMPPRGWRGIFHTWPIGWPPCGLGVPPPRVPSGRLEPRRLGRNTSRQVSVRQTPNGEVPCCVPERRTRLIAGPYERCPTSGGRAIGV